jgi:glycosyltransferase involved in cell wall biosynthesis
MPPSTSKYPLEITLVIPVFNEEESLPELARQIDTALDGRSYEVLLIDDGSSDASWDVIHALHQTNPAYQGIRFQRNYGKSAALAVGFERARGAYVCTLDADLQDDPNELPGMIDRLIHGADLVGGWKKKRHDPLSKTIPSRFFNAVTRKMSGIALHDFNCGLKAYRAEVIKTIRVYGELHRYIPLLAKWEGFGKIEEHVVAHRPRRFGVSKFGLERFLRGFLDLLTVLFQTRYAARPMHFFGSLGIVSFVVGFAIATYLSIDKLVFGAALQNRPLLLMSVLMIITGTQLFLAGLLGEMIIKPRMERVEIYRIRHDTTAPSA